jgi:hypothetical protein
MKIAKLELTQLNPQLDKIDQLEKRLALLEEQHKQVAFQTAQLDYTHARPTVNNITFTWTGGSTTLSWLKGFIKDKNALLDTGRSFSQAPSFKTSGGAIPVINHNIPVLAGSLTLNASTYYWLGWDSTQNRMISATDVGQLFAHHNVQIVCQLFTGTAGQTGTAGGGGSQGGVDLSGARYKLF